MSAAPGGLLLLSDADVRALYTPARAVQGAERAFRILGDRSALPPQSMGFPVAGGGFHVKAALVTANAPVFAAKINGNFPGNPGRSGLPTIQGALYFADAANGAPLALIASGALTALRTAAATAVAVKYLTPSDASVAAIIGCGVQGRVHLELLREVRPIARILLADADPARAEAIARDLGSRDGVEVVACRTIAEATKEAAIVVTCTTATTPFLDLGDLRPGAFVAAVGADNPQKSELTPRLLASAAVYCDLTSQCAEIGDLHHAIAAGAMTIAGVRGELGDVIVGRVQRGHGETAIFDSTGTALLDVTAAQEIYGAALRAGRGGRFSLQE